MIEGHCDRVASREHILERRHGAWKECHHILWCPGFRERVEELLRERQRDDGRCCSYISSSDYHNRLPPFRERIGDLLRALQDDLVVVVLDRRAHPLEPLV